MSSHFFLSSLFFPFFPKWSMLLGILHGNEYLTWQYGTFLARARPFRPPWRGCAILSTNPSHLQRASLTGGFGGGYSSGIIADEEGP